MNPLETKLRSKTTGWVIVTVLKRCLIVSCWVALFVYAYLFASLLFKDLPTYFLNFHALVFVIIATPLLIVVYSILIQRRDVQRMVIAVEEQYPALRDRLVTAMEVSESKSEIQSEFSRALAQGLEKEISELLDRFGFGKVSSTKKLKVPLLICLLFFGFVTAHASIQPEFFNVALRQTDGSSGFHLFKSGASNGDEFPAFVIQVLPGDVEIAEGSDLLVQAKIEGYEPEKVFLYVREDADDWTWRVYPMEPLKKRGAYQYRMTHVLQPSFYYVKADHQESETYKIKLYDSLRIENAAWTMQFPEHMRMPEETRQGWVTKLTVPEGTRFELVLYLNRPVKSGVLSMEGVPQFEFQGSGGRRLTTTFHAKRDYYLELDVISEGGDPLLGTSPLWIQVVPDLPPYLEVLEPLHRAYLYPTEEVPFVINIDDDFGIASVVFSLRYRGKEVRVEWLPEDEKGKDKIELRNVLKLEDFDLSPRDLIFAHVEVLDNRPLEEIDREKHVVRSDLFTFVLRDYTEQFVINAPEYELPTLRSAFGNVLAEQASLLEDMWTHLSRQPNEDSSVITGKLAQGGAS